MKRLIFLTFVFCTHLAFGQYSTNTKRALKRLLSVEKGQDSKDLLICNADSNFFKQDTLYLFDKINYFYQSNECCEFLDWKFRQDGFMIQNESQICKEPSTAKVISSNDIYTVLISRKKRKTFLSKYRKAQLVEKFLVSEIVTLPLPKVKDNYSRIKLIRIK